MSILPEPLISVLMPVYNTENFVQEAVASILTQTFRDFELIIINDGSTDSSWSKIQEMQDERIVRLQNEKNSGVVASYLKGLSLARGKLIAFMDSDDISFSDRFEAQIRFLEAHPEVAIVGSPIQYMQESGGKLDQFWRPPTCPNVIRWTLFFEDAVANPTVMIRKQALNILKDDLPSLRYSFDYEMWIKLARTHCIANLEQVKLFYRTHGQSYSHSNIQSLRMEDIALKRAAMQEFLGREVEERVIQMIAHPEAGQDELAVETLNVLTSFRSQFFKTVFLTREEKVEIHKDFMHRFYPILSLYPKRGSFLRYYFYLARIDPAYCKELMQKVTGRKNR